MKRLMPLDLLFLLFEQRHQPLHVGALSLFHPPHDAPPSFVADLAARLRESTQPAPPFNRRLAGGFGLKFWDEDAEFDLAQHFVHLALPKPGRIRDLLAMVSRVHSAHLDRAYPLWRMYLIEGLEDGRIATYSKIHHSLVDGVAGIRLMLKSMSPDRAESEQMPPPWEVRTRKSRLPSLPVPQVSVGGAKALRGLLREGRHALPQVAGQRHIAGAGMPRAHAARERGGAGKIAGEGEQIDLAGIGQRVAGSIAADGPDRKAIACGVERD